MTILLNQSEVETKMYDFGVERMKQRIAEAEDKGSADRNPYAATVLRDFVQPLAQLIDITVNTGMPGRQAAHVSLLRSLDFLAVSVIAVRGALVYLLGPSRDNNYGQRRLGAHLGALVHNELILAQVENYNPDLYYTLARDFERKRSKDIRHRVTVFKQQAGKAGMLIDDWGIGARHQVGLWLVGALENLGMIELQKPPERGGKKLGGQRDDLSVSLAPHIWDTLEKIKGLVETTAPGYGPCVEPPRDWTDLSNGGYHTPAMRRALPWLVKAPGPSRALLKGHQMPTVLAAVNALQHTAWSVNRAILEVVQADGLPEDANLKKPLRPEWLDAHDHEAAMSEAQLAEFTTWKGQMRDWYTKSKLAGPMRSRFYSATRMAETFKEYPTLYFVYFADSRGRLYPLTYGLNPQGSDLQKALLQFAHGCSIGDPKAWFWFRIHGANKFGFDKAALVDRAAWADEHDDLIRACAAKPLENRGWEKADNPLQFLAWCFEYAAAKTDPAFRSHLPISMDGSCNGLQHFSAMLRDEVGGTATNLTNNKVMADIYKQVALVAETAIRNDVESEYQKVWALHGIDRSVVKRSVMTTPYGVTKKSATEYVISDYLNENTLGMQRNQFFKASIYLMEHVWPAIGKVVVKARAAMDWLSRGARRIVKARPDSEGVISWVTPSGFLATQGYYEADELRINTHIHGVTRVVVKVENDTPDLNAHANGLAPNFVHSMDASHLHLCTAVAASRGITEFAMIHDDYGVPADKAQMMFDLIRESFVGMYTNSDPIQELFMAYPEMGEPPAPGNLDLNEVLLSDYFFS